MKLQDSKDNAGDAGKQATMQSLKLYKLEYEKAAIRYENIYRAVWTNFSYMAIVSGAILSFGTRKFSTELTAFLACLPLLFWYMATYEPLNRYGDQTLDRLCELEEILSSYDFMSQKQGSGEGDEDNQLKRGLRHFRQYRELRTSQDRKLPRVRWVVRPVFWILYLVAIYLACQAFCGFLRYIVPVVLIIGAVIWLAATAHSKWKKGLSVQK